MKISRNWLQNFFTEPLPETEVISDALTFHAFEIDGIEKIGEDNVLDVKVTANRGHDCLSHRGIAAELSAILKMPLDAQKDPFAKKPDFSKKSDTLSVTIEDPKLCRRFVGAYITGAKVGPSPEWMRQSLEAMGQRSINNIVDATNLVMFNMGQPSHVFDANKLTKTDGRITLAVRAARDGETLVGLDDKEYALTPAMLAVADGSGEAVSIAGIKGGKATGIDEATTDIVLEAANWHGPMIRKSSQALKLRTDASARFEQEISPELAPYGIEQLVGIILATAGGTVEGYVDVYPEPEKTMGVSVSLGQINRVLGIELSGAEVADVFSRLGLAYKEENGTFEVIPPFQRLDLEIPEDLIEEVARIIGYDRIPAAELPPAEKPASVNANFYAAEKAREELLSQGYSEVLTSVFAEEGERAVANKIGGEKPYLRDSLITGLTDALAKNIPNKDLLGLKEVKLFEIGTVWKGGEEQLMVGTISEKQPGEEKSLVPLSAEQYDDAAVSTTERYETFSKYPYIVRDIAMWTPAGTTEDDIRGVLQNEAGPLCVRLAVFDRFEKGDRVSYGFRLIFQSFEKTLTDDEVKVRMDAVYTAVAAKGWEVR